jgi:uncharacterized cupredoxin-like copper-binding protein
VRRAAVAVLVAGVIGVMTFAIGSAIAGTASASSPRGLGPGLVTVDVGIRYSKFSFSELSVRPGTTVQFIVHNNDPIHHEFIVGDASVHFRHEHGTEATHPPVPGEVSVAPLDVGETFYRFDRPGRYLFACHLPGHFAYGMKGWVTVTAA